MSDETPTPPLVLWWQSTILAHGGGHLACAIGVPDQSLEAFGERLTREGGLIVIRYALEVRENGIRYVVDQQPEFIGIAATGRITYYAHPVRLETGDELDTETTMEERE